MMDSVTTWYQYLVANPSTATLLLGVLSFGIAFLILQMTRWGQENPVAKCVVLSVWAHVVLLVYAYTTNLITHVIPPPPAQPIPIRIAEVESTPEPGNDPQAGQNQPFWQQIPAELDLDLAGDSELAPQSSDFQLPESLLESPLEAIEDSAEVAESLPVATQIPSVDSQDQADPVLEELLTPRDTPLPELETTPVAEASPQGMMAAENSLRSAARQPERNPDQWLAEQMAEQAPQRMDGLEDEKKLDQEMAPMQAAMELENQWKQQWPNDVDNTEHSLEPLVQATRQDSSSVNPDPMGQNQPLTAHDIPRQASTDQPLVAGLKRAGDGQPLPVRYAKRQQRTMQWLEEQGGSKESEAAIARALAYLALIQQADGSWNPRATDAGRELQVLGHNRQGAGAQADTGITGLAVLAFQGAGHTHLEGAYREQVRMGLDYLLARQQRNGCLAGSAQFYAQMYCHSMALLAISEAYAVTGDQRLAEAVGRGVAYSLQAQNRKIGGWRYQPGDSGDMSQFGWQVMALNSASLNGTPLDANSVALMKLFLKGHTQGTHGGLAHYRYGENVSPVMTAEAMLCRYLLQEPVSVAAAEEACAQIRGPLAADGTFGQLPGRGVDNVYFWYYATLALHQMAVDPELQSSQVVQETWQQWNQQLKLRLLALQDGSEEATAGSWDPKWFTWGCYGGRVYSTAMSALCLQVYYRYDLEAEERLRTAGLPVGPEYMPASQGWTPNGIR